MFVSRHVFFGAIFSFLIYFLFQDNVTLLSAFIIFFSSFLIDADHYLYYLYDKKDFGIFGIFRAYKWSVACNKKSLSLPKSMRNKIYDGIYIFHGIEAVLLAFFLGFINKYFFFVAIGFLFHLFLDFIYQVTFFNPGRIDRVSIIYDFIKSKNFIRIEDVR